MQTQNTLDNSNKILGIKENISPRIVRRSKAKVAKLKTNK